MANNEIHARIKNKVNPALSSVLLDGELAVLRSNGKSMLKIGDGSNALSDIAYVEAPQDAVSALSSAIDNKIYIDDRIDQTISGKSDLSIVKLPKEEYEMLAIGPTQLSANVLYIVESDYIDAYSQQIKNLSAGTEPFDAVNMEQLNSLSSKLYQLPVDGIPGSDMALSVQTAIEKAEASISSIPDPIDPLSATVSGQYADALATKGMVSTRISAEIDHQLDARIPYSIVEPETSGTASLSVQVQDHAINVLSADSSITNILFIFPQKMTGKARDFFVRLTITSITDVPTIEFQEQDGSAVSFDIDDMSWAEIESGVNLMLFTETAQ